VQGGSPRFQTPISSDYSLWDCYKTGVGDPALSCKLTLWLVRNEVGGWTAIYPADY